MSDNSDSSNKKQRTEEPEEEPTKPIQYRLTIDTEQIGRKFKYPIVAIGAVLGDEKGNIIRSAAFCSKVPEAMMAAIEKGEPLTDDSPELKGDTFEKKCFNNFWLKNKDILVRINAEADGDCVEKLYLWLKEIDKEFGPFGRELKKTVNFRFVSDNPSYDHSKINVEFFKRGYEYPLLEMFFDYVGCSDPSEQIKQMNSAQREDSLNFVKAPHDHWPLNDAIGIYQAMCGIEKHTCTYP